MNGTRRQLVQGGLSLAGGGVLSGCGGLPVLGRQAAKVPRLGYLGSGFRGEPHELVFMAGLRDVGYVAAQNLEVAWRFAEGRDEHLPPLASKLVRLPVELIFAAGPSATLAAKHAATTTPIVMCFGGDPIGTGLIASLARPGGNVTGIAALSAQISAKRLELFAAALPGISRVAAFWDATANPGDKARLNVAARSLGLQVQALEVRTPDDFAGAFEAALAGGAEALFAAQSSLFLTHRERIAAFAASNRLPVSAVDREFAEAGALLTYGANLLSMYRRAATQVAKILKGAKPADLPVEQPTTFDFVVNLKTAQALGLTIPPSVLAQATEVLQ